MIPFDHKTSRLYALVMLPVVFVAVWFIFFRSRISEPPVRAIEVGRRTFSVEIADTPEARERGLGFRDSLCADCAMLFRFDAPGRYGFWMRGMRFPLDIAWIRDGWIVHIERNVSPDRADIIYPDADATEVLETNSGMLADVREGDGVVLSGD